jgi:hypothetical protein
MPWDPFNMEKVAYVELHNLCCSSDMMMIMKSGRMRWAGHVAHIGGMRKAYKVLVRKAEENRSL